MYVNEFSDFSNNQFAAWPELPKNWKSLGFSEFSRHLRPPIPACCGGCALTFEERQEAYRRHNAPTPSEIEEAKNFDYEDPGILLWQRRADDREKLIDLKQHARFDLERTLKKVSAIAPLWEHRKEGWILLSSDQIGEILRFEAKSPLGERAKGPVNLKPLSGEYRPDARPDAGYEARKAQYEKHEKELLDEADREYEAERQNPEWQRSSDTEWLNFLKSHALAQGIDDAVDWARGWVDASPVALWDGDERRALTINQTEALLRAWVLAFHSVPASARPATPLENLTYAPGLVGEIVNWIEASAMRPNRILALGSALTVVGTLTGRRVAGPTRSATHLYVIGLARTGAGKQHVIDCAKELLDSAGARQHVGPSEFISGPAVINSLANLPLSLCLQDEFGSLLKRINNKRASGFEAQIRKFLLELWGLNFKAYDTPEWAGRSKVTIYTPALSLFGLSTHDDFFTALRACDLPGGFINRFLLLSSDDRAPEQEPALHDVPEEIAAKLRTLYEWRHGNAMNAGQLMSPQLNPKPDIRPWNSDSAKAVYNDFKREVESQIDAQPNLENFLSRSPEMAIRIATILAAGRSVGNFDFAVDRSDVEWGVAVARASGDRMSSEAADRMVEETPTHGEALNKVMATIKREGRIKHSDLFYHVKGSLNAKGLGDIIKTLEESETIEVEGWRPPEGGPLTKFYRIAKQRRSSRSIE